MMRFGTLRALVLLALPAATRGFDATPKLEQLQRGVPGAPSSPNRPFVIGVAGATASGKSSVVAEVVRLLDAEERVASVTQDCFYNDLTEAERDAAYNSNHDFDRARRANFFQTGRMVTSECSLLASLSPRRAQIPTPSTGGCSWTS